ncbi:MAG: hypothetical protein C4324_08350 [Blastocatellia bacterium]
MLQVSNLPPISQITIFTKRLIRPTLTNAVFRHFNAQNFKTLPCIKRHRFRNTARFQDIIAESSICKVTSRSSSINRRGNVRVKNFEKTR